MNPKTTARLRILLGFLRAGRVLDGASSVLLLSTVVLARGAASPVQAAGIALALALGFVEKYLAWRVALDVECFAWLLEQPPVAAFDEALAAFLGQKPAAAPRSMGSRWRGARRLVRHQAIVLGLQAGVVAVLTVAGQLR